MTRLNNSGYAVVKQGKVCQTLQALLPWTHHSVIMWTHQQSFHSTTSLINQWVFQKLSFTPCQLAIYLTSIKVFIQRYAVINLPVEFSPLGLWLQMEGFSIVVGSSTWGEGSLCYSCSFWLLSTQVHETCVFDSFWFIVVNINIIKPFSCIQLNSLTTESIILSPLPPTLPPLSVHQF